MTLRICLLILVCFGLAVPVRAAEPAPPTPNAFVGYNPVSVKTLIDLYWKTGLLQVDNQQAVAEYIQVSACDLYHKTFHDDFAWPDTLQKTAAYLKAYQKYFGSRFVKVQPIALGRYLPDKGYFEITEETQYKDMRRLEFANFTGTLPVCNDVPLPKSAPLVAIAGFDQGVTIDKIKMDAARAKKVIAAIDGRKKAAAEINSQNYRRFAYVRFYFTIVGFDRVDSGADLKTLLLGPSLSFRAKLDGYEIYSDLEGTMLLDKWRPATIKSQ